MKKFLFNFGVIIFLISCAPTTVRFSKNFYSPTKEIEILTEFPTNREFEKIAILTVSDEDIFPLKDPKSIFIDKAKELGADALVIDSVLLGVSQSTIFYVPGNSEIDPKDVLIVWAYAIKYK